MEEQKTLRVFIICIAAVAIVALLVLFL